MLLTMLLFALGNIPLLAWIKGRALHGAQDSSYSMHSAARYGSFSRDSTGNMVETPHSPAARDLNWFERMDLSVLRQVFRRPAL